MQNNIYDNDTHEDTLGFYRSEQVSTMYRFFLDEEIGSPRKYRELVQCLLTAQEGDLVELIINSGGGRLDAAGQIIGAIQQTDAMVAAVLSGDCLSAAGMIALSCHEVVVTPFTKFMAHSASYGSGGKAKDVKAYVDYSDKILRELFFDVYEGFYSEEEIEEILKGHEDWLTPEEVGQRLKKRQEYFEGKRAAIEEEPTPEPPKPRRRKKAVDTPVED